MKAANNDRPRQRVLIVDDSRTVRAYTARLLLSRGYEVEMTDNPWIFDRVSGFRPHLVLMGVNREVSLKGTLAIAALRERPIARATQFVLYSELPDDQLEILVRDSGADGFLSKRSRKDEFLSGVRRFLDLASATHDDRTAAMDAAGDEPTPPRSRSLKSTASGIAHSTVMAM